MLTFIIFLLIPISISAVDLYFGPSDASLSFKLTYPKELVEDVYVQHGYSTCQPTTNRTAWLQLHTPVNCSDLFTEVISNMGRPPVWPPPTAMPEEMKSKYLLNGFVKYHQAYIAEQQHGNPDVPDVTNELKQLIELAKADQLWGSYRESRSVAKVLSRFPVKGLFGAVFGTMKPWAEAFLLAAGASKVLTVEYRKMTTQYPGHSTATPQEWATSMLQGGERPDFAVSFSSFEHDGLGRYGDFVQPFADVRSMQRVSCYVKPGGLFFFSVPVGFHDTVVWNLHRIYGPAMLPMMTANWEVIDIFYENHWYGSNFLEFWMHLAVPLEVRHPLIVLRNVGSGCRVQEPTLA